VELTTNSRFLEMRYTTPKGWQATPHFHPSEEEQLETRLVGLYRRHIEAEVVNLLTNEVVGGVVADDGINGWQWWYSPCGLEARTQPANCPKYVTSPLRSRRTLAQLRKAHVASTSHSTRRRENADTRVSAKRS
jgi:hypothetical protein